MIRAAQAETRGPEIPVRRAPEAGEGPVPAGPPLLDRRRLRRLRIRVLVTVLAVAGGVAALLFLRRGELAGMVATSVDALREAGPVAFFAGMAVLPAIGFPLLPFSLVAGPVFAPVMGVGAVVACAVAAVAANVALSYLLASRTLRPLIQRLLVRLGYRLPELPAGSAWQVVWLVRLAPGLPFWTQSYLLGIGRVPFVPYLVVSTLLPAAYIGGTIVFGDALFRGHMKHALFAAAAVGLVAIAVQLWRRRTTGRRGHPATPRSTREV